MMTNSCSSLENLGDKKKIAHKEEELKERVMSLKGIIA